MATRIRTPFVIEFTAVTGVVAEAWTATMAGDLIDFTALVTTGSGGANTMAFRKAGVSMLAVANPAWANVADTLTRTGGLAAAGARSFAIGDVLSCLASAGAGVGVCWAYFLPTGSQNPSTLALNAQ